MEVEKEKEEEKKNKMNMEVKEKVEFQKSIQKQYLSESSDAYEMFKLEKTYRFFISNVANIEINL